MSIEKLDEQISRCKDRKKSYNREMDKKISELEKKRDEEITAEATKTLARYHLTWEELLRLKSVGKERFLGLLNSNPGKDAEIPGVGKKATFPEPIPKENTEEENDDAKK